MKVIGILLFSLTFIFNASATENTLEFPVKIHYKTYSVKGDSEEEIDASFNDSRPDFLKTADFDGYTIPGYSYHTDDDTCEIISYEVNITYYLPILQKSSVSPDTTEAFRDYLNRLYRHEQTHCAIILKVLDDTYQSFKLGQNGNCAEQTQIAIEMKPLICEYNEQFDTYTSHDEIELAQSPFGEEAYLDMCKIPFSPITMAQ